MISSEIFIIKRDGKREVFSLDKIKNAIAKAFLSVGSFATQDVITNVLNQCGRNPESGGSSSDGRALLQCCKSIYAVSSEAFGRP